MWFTFSTQHALLNLRNKWHSCLDNSGVVGATLIDLSKGTDCLPHELISAKLHAHGVEIKNLKLSQEYLSKWTQRVKLVEAATRGVLWKKAFLQNLPNSQENTFFIEHPWTTASKIWFYLQLMVEDSLRRITRIYRRSIISQYFF